MRHLGERNTRVPQPTAVRPIAIIHTIRPHLGSHYASVTFRVCSVVHTERRRPGVCRWDPPRGSEGRQTFKHERKLRRFYKLLACPSGRAVRAWSAPLPGCAYGDPACGRSRIGANRWKRPAVELLMLESSMAGPVGMPLRGTSP